MGGFHRSQIHERTTSLRILGIIFRVLRLEVSVYDVNITNQIQTTFVPGGGGIKSVVEVIVNSKKENSQDFCPNYVQEFGLWNHITVMYSYEHLSFFRIDQFNNDTPQQLHTTRE